MTRLFAIALVAMAACSGPTKVSDFTEDSEYIVIQGKMALASEREGSRLIIYLDTGDKVLTCIVDNDRNKGLLKSVSEKINENPELDIIIFGKKIEEEWFEFLEGVDVEIVAISYYPYVGGQRQIVLLSYGTRFADVMRSVSWKDFILRVGSKAAKAAL
jgi:hypothetical protein